MKKITEHKFAMTFEGGIMTEAEIYNRDTNEVEKIELWNPEAKPAAWNYLERAGSVFFNLASTIDELQMTISFIKESSKLESLTDKRGSEILKYMVKNWITRYVSIYEISLCLINEVLDLGYTGRTITKGNIESNRHVVENDQLEKIRRRIYNLVTMKLSGTEKKTIESLNNKIKHLGQLSHNSISDLSLYELRKTWSLYKDKSDFEIDKGLLRNNITKELVELTEKMVDSIIELLDFLNIIYESKSSELKT